jgi:hypothetical protein
VQQSKPESSESFPRAPGKQCKGNSLTQKAPAIADRSPFQTFLHFLMGAPTEKRVVQTVSKIDLFFVFWGLLFGFVLHKMEVFRDGDDDDPPDWP